MSEIDSVFSCPIHSAGITLHRSTNTEPEVLLLQAGGSFWAKKDAGAWSIAKGLIEERRDAGRRRVLPSNRRESSIASGL